MRASSRFIFLAVLFVFAVVARADDDIVPCAAFPTSAPPCAAPAIATLDGAPILLSDLDEKTRKAVESLDESVANARRKVVRDAIDDVLLKQEAARRGVSWQDLLNAEVRLKVAHPTSEEVEKEIASDPDKYVRNGQRFTEWAASELYQRRLSEREREFLTTLEKRAPVKLGVSPSSSLSPDAIVATVGKQTVTYAQVRESADADATVTRIGVSGDEKTAVDHLVHERLLQAEAARRSLSAEALLAAEVQGKVIEATEDEVRKEWESAKARYGEDFEKAKPKAIERLAQKRKGQAQKAFDAQLLSGHVVKTNFEIPPWPKRALDLTGAPFTGAADAPVTLVEFGDFECPPCRMVAHSLDEIIPSYGGRVRYVFREFPLDFHPFAWKAAEAALAAHAQGKFQAYAHLLFANQEALDVDSLKKYATSAGLDRKRFDQDLDSGSYGAAVLADRRQGARLGVRGTPAIFINGVWLEPSSFSPDGLKTALDKAIESYSH